MAINLKNVKGRRSLSFSNYDDILHDAQQLMNHGSIVGLGNWTAGQNFEHLAKSMDASIDGVDYMMPWPMRMIARLFKSRFLNNPLTPGFMLPVKLEPAFGPSHEISSEVGFKKLSQSIERIKNTNERSPSPAFGEMHESDWIKLHCRHAELHLSFLKNE